MTHIPFVRSNERKKQTGEVFTPQPLVKEILKKLPREVWGPEKTFIDNSCGDGNFLVEVIAKKIRHNKKRRIRNYKEQALKTTYGVDLMQDNVDHARARIIKKYGKKYRDIVHHNIIQGDGLDPKTYDRFDEKPLLTY